jgi:hypothetical protein
MTPYEGTQGVPGQWYQPSNVPLSARVPHLRLSALRSVTASRRTSVRK